MPLRAWTRLILWSSASALLLGVSLGAPPPKKAKVKAPPADNAWRALAELGVDKSVKFLKIYSEIEGTLPANAALMVEPPNGLNQAFNAGLARAIERNGRFTLTERAGLGEEVEEGAKPDAASATAPAPRRQRVKATHLEVPAPTPRRWPPPDLLMRYTTLSGPGAALLHETGARLGLWPLAKETPACGVIDLIDGGAGTTQRTLMRCGVDAEVGASGALSQELIGPRGAHCRRQTTILVLPENITSIQHQSVEAHLAQAGCRVIRTPPKIQRGAAHREIAYHFDPSGFDQIAPSLTQAWRPATFALRIKLKTLSRTADDLVKALESSGQAQAHMDPDLSLAPPNSTVECEHIRVEAVDLTTGVIQARFVLLTTAQTPRLIVAQSIIEMLGGGAPTAWIEARTEPQDARLRVDRDLYERPHRPMLLEVKPGGHTLEMLLANQRQPERRIKLEAVAHGYHVATLATDMGYLEVTTLPEEGVEVLIDGVSRGKTPFKAPFSVSTGEHVIEARGCDASRSTKAMVRIAQTTRVKIALPGELIASVDPPHARITFRGKVIKNGEKITNVDAGIQEVKFALDGFTPRIRTAIIKSCEETKIHEPFDSHIVVRSDPPNSEILIKNKSFGETPKKIKLGPGRDYRVICQLCGVGRGEETVNLKPGEIHETLIPLREATIWRIGPHLGFINDGDGGGLAFGASGQLWFNALFGVLVDSSYLAESEAVLTSLELGIRLGNTSPGWSTYLSGGVLSQGVADTLYGQAGFHLQSCLEGHSNLDIAPSLFIGEAGEPGFKLLVSYTFGSGGDAWINVE